METLISPADRIFVAGHRGMAGSAIVRRLQSGGYGQLLTANRDQVDLRDPSATTAWFAQNKPDVVVLAAARVGGIHANATYPADFLLDNLKIQNNVIETAWSNGAKRLLFLGSSCIYPKFATQPIREDSLLTGSLEPTNEWYAIAKITGIQLCRALKLQYGFDAICLMPTNLYGPGDNYHPVNSHVLPALIRRFYEAASGNADTVTCWGTGTPRREFLHVDDLADAVVFCLEHWRPSDQETQFLNVGTGKDLSIRELAELVADGVGYRGKLVWDSSKPDGTPRKLLDVGRLSALGWSASIGLEQGLRSTILDYVQHQLSGHEVRL
jgi:GDP-L-fucose synthase